MKSRKTQLALFLAVPLVLVYFTFFSGASLFYIYHGIDQFLSDKLSFLTQILLWTSVGVSFSLLSALTCWPFALSVATLLEHNKMRKVTDYSVSALSYFSTLPLIFFVFVFVEVVGEEGFNLVKTIWHSIFASSNLLTQVLAFALTLLLYPLTIFPFVGDKVSIDLFFKNMLSAVIEFAEVGLVAAVVAMGLFLYILPKMILHMRRQLQEDQNLKSFEIIQSLGGTAWESIHLTVMQSMKSRFNIIITYFTRICFFEGLITYSLFSQFILDEKSFGQHWGASLGAVFISGTLESQEKWGALLGISGVVVLAYFVFMIIEGHFRRQSELGYV